MVHFRTTTNNLVFVVLDSLFTHLMYFKAFSLKFMHLGHSIYLQNDKKYSNFHKTFTAGSQ